MKIIDEVLGDYRIDIDSSSISYTVKDKEDKMIQDKKRGLVSSNTVYGYYSSIENAILKIVNLNLNKGEDTVTLKEYLSEFKQAKSVILNLLKNE